MLDERGDVGDADADGDPHGEVGGRTGVPLDPDEDRYRQRRARFLEAAIDHLGERGYASLTLAEVARRAGFQPRVIRRHFSSVDELVVASVQALTYRRLADLEAAAADLPDDPAAWIDAAVDLLWSVFSGPRFLAGVELWVRSRTDARLAAELYPAEQVMGRRLYATVSTVLPPTLRDSTVAHEAIWSSIYLMRGLAMRRLLRDEPGHEVRILAAWKQHLLVLTGTGGDPRDPHDPDDPDDPDGAEVSRS